MSRFGLQPLDAIMPYLLADIAEASSGASFRELDERVTLGVRQAAAERRGDPPPKEGPP